MALRHRERKLLLISILGLLAAIVCFGLLDSSGSVENGVVKLGGAFAGFIITVVVLNRVWGDEDDLIKLAEKYDSEVVYDEIVKFLDLRKSSPHDADQKAPLTDYYRLRRVGESSDIHMHYATTSDGIDFVGSSTHPNTSRWRKVKVSHIGPSEQIFKKEYEIDTGLGDLAVGQETVIIHQLLYHNAFKALEGEWLETHLEHPTGRLAMMILMPNDMMATSATGLWSVARNEPARTSVQPAVMQDGSLVYWAISSPEHGARYAIQWTWLPR